MSFAGRWCWARKENFCLACLWLLVCEQCRLTNASMGGGVRVAVPASPPPKESPSGLCQGSTVTRRTKHYTHQLTFLSAFCCRFAISSETTRQRLASYDYGPSSVTPHFRCEWVSTWLRSDVGVEQTSMRLCQHIACEVSRGSLAVLPTTLQMS